MVSKSPSLANHSLCANISCEYQYCVVRSSKSAAESEKLKQLWKLVFDRPLPGRTVRPNVPPPPQLISKHSDHFCLEVMLIFNCHESFPRIANLVAVCGRIRRLKRMAVAVSDPTRDPTRKSDSANSVSSEARSSCANSFAFAR